jgi:hypothetical protein
MQAVVQNRPPSILLLVYSHKGTIESSHIASPSPHMLDCPALVLTEQLDINNIRTMPWASQSFTGDPYHEATQH